MVDLTLLVKGQLFTGWQSVEINLGIEQLAAAFTVAITATTGTPASWTIKKGDPCVLQVAGKPIITGHVDDHQPLRNENGRSVVVSGRSKTGDLVDCAAIHKTGSWSNRPLEAICADLCAPFGIAVVVDCATGKPFPRFAIQQGESPFEAMDRAAKLRGVLLMTTPGGALLLTRAGKTSRALPLVYGSSPIESAGFVSSAMDRFSEYIIKGQSPDDGITPTKAVEYDSEIIRYRPLIIIADSGDGATYKDRARWERNVRRGRGDRYACTVTGWEQGGSVWLPNDLQHVTDSDFGIDAPLLLTDVNLILDEKGSRANLELTRPEAYELIGENSKTKKPAWEKSPW